MVCGGIQVNPPRIITDHMRLAVTLFAAQAFAHYGSLDIDGPVADAKELILAHRKLRMLTDPMGGGSAPIMSRLDELMRPYGFGGCWSAERGLELIRPGIIPLYPVPL